MLVSMAKVRIVGLRLDLEAALSAVHRLGVVHVAPLVPPRPADLPTVRPAALDRELIAQVEGVLGRLGTLLALCSTATSSPGLTREIARRRTADLLADAAHVLDALEPEVQRSTGRVAALEAELSGLRRYQELVHRLLPLADTVVELSGFEVVALIFEQPYGFVVDTLREELQAIARRQFELITAEADDGSIVALLVFSRRFAPEVHRLLQSEQLTELHLPPEYRSRPLGEILQEIDRRREAIPRELAALRDEIEEILSPVQERLAAWQTGLLDRLDELMLVGQLLRSDYTFALFGWVPERELASFEATLRREFAGRVVVERLKTAEAERHEMPVLMENPYLLRPFEVLLRLLPIPRYGTVDPTPFVAFFFPLFFGLMVADIGYGALLLLLSLWLQWRRVGRPWLLQAARVMGAGALAAIAFGVAFGEFFGDLGRSFGLHPLIAERSEAIQPLLLFSVGLGAVQVALGLVLGIVTGYVERQGRQALSRAAILMALVAVFALVGVAADLLPRGLITPGVALLAVATALLVYTVGLVGPLEVFGALGNILSYTRLVAVGLSSAILAQVANNLAGRTGSILVGLVVGALFHGLNLALALFSPSIHSLRLQYVEFFGRFFQSGGRPYAPLRSRLEAPPERVLGGASPS